MAYDLVVGKSNKVKDSPEIVVCIAFDELPSIARLAKRVDSNFLTRISSFFTDQDFSQVEIDQAISELHPLLTRELALDEQLMLYKLVSVLSYAQAKDLPLFGVAD